MDQSASNRQNARRNSSDGTSTAPQHRGSVTASATSTNAHPQEGSASAGPLYVASAAWRREPRLLYLSTLGYAAVPEAQEEQQLEAALAASVISARIPAATVPTAGISYSAATLASSSSSSTSSSSTFSFSRQGSSASSSSLPEPTAATATVLWTDEPPSYTELIALEGGDRSAAVSMNYRSGAVSSAPTQTAPETGRSAQRNAPLASPPQKTGPFRIIKKRLSLGSSGSSP